MTSSGNLNTIAKIIKFHAKNYYNACQTPSKTRRIPKCGFASLNNNLSIIKRQNEKIKQIARIIIGSNALSRKYGDI